MQPGPADARSRGDPSAVKPSKAPAPGDRLLPGIPPASTRCLTRTALGIVSAAMAGACGGEAAELPGGFRDAPLPVQPTLIAPDDRWGLGRVPSVAGVDAEGDLVFGTAEGLFRARSDGPEPIPFYTERPDVEVAAGGVVAVLPRAEGGAWIVATNGLYRTQGRFHVLVDPSLTGTGRAFVTSAPPFDGLWITTADGLVRLTTVAVYDYEVADPGALRGLDAAADGSAVLLVRGETVSLLAAAAGGLEETEVPLAFAGAQTVLRVDGRWWVGGDALFAGDAPDEGWTRHPVPSPVTALGRGPDGRAWWCGGEGVYALDDGEARRIHSGPVDRAAFGPSGDLWVVTGTVAARWRAEDDARPSFAADVSPWLAEQGCIDCHALPALDFRRFDDFRSVATDALSRVASGDMPRCGNGLCAPEDRLRSEDYAVLERWIETGMKE